MAVDCLRMFDGEEMKITVPGYKPLNLHHLVLDYNGTLAHDGKLIDGVRESLALLAQELQIHIITADTFGSVQEKFVGTGYDIFVLKAGNEDRGKLNYLEGLCPEQCVCIGNGRNDRLMLKEAALGVAVMQGEGAAVETLLAADIVVPDILAGLGILAQPLRLIATLRS